VGVGYATPLHPSSPHTTVVAWRLAAWLVSALTFAAQIAYEHWRVRQGPLRGALHCSAGVALGAFLLAVWINARGYWDPSARHSPLAPLALVAFPLLTAVPALLVGLAALALLRRATRLGR
jgi:hypothetical protein